MSIPYSLPGPDAGSITIGILVTGHSPTEIRADLGDYDDMLIDLLKGHGFSYRSYAVVDNEFPASVQECDGWLITGSKHGVYEPHAWIPPLEQFIRDVYADGRPMVGVCFGHQIIAQALGGKVEKYPGGWAVGRQEYIIDGQPMALNAWHQDQVVSLPSDATVIGYNAFCANAALLYGDRILTIQPHPEHTPEFIRWLIEYRGRGLIPEEQLDRAIAQLGKPTQHQAMGERIAAFLKRDG